MGWLPYGMVYSASLYVLGSGKAEDGALMMLALGLDVAEPAGDEAVCQPAQESAATSAFQAGGRVERQPVGGMVVVAWSGWVAVGYLKT